MIPAPKNYPYGTATEHVMQQAYAYFGDEAEADAWLTAPNPKLSGKSPMQIIRTSPGKVENLIIAMETGF